MKRALLAALMMTMAHPSMAMGDSSDDTVVTEAPEDQPVVEDQRVWAQVRLTYYTESGRTYSGGQTYAGSTACSWNFAIGTRFMLPDGEVFVCNDRGRLGDSGWLDLWRRPDLAAEYGPYVVVEVLP